MISFGNLIIAIASACAFITTFSMTFGFQLFTMFYFTIACIIISQEKTDDVQNKP